MECAHRDAVPCAAAQVRNQRRVLVKVLPVHGNETLAVRAQVWQVQLFGFQGPRHGRQIGACFFGIFARRRLCERARKWLYNRARRRLYTQVPVPLLDACTPEAQVQSL